MMSINSSSRKQAGRSANRTVYAKSFLRDAHRLLITGYGRIRPEELRDTDEEVITQRLVEAINNLIEGDGAEPWMRRYIVDDNQTVRFPGREGKERPRVDIEIILCDLFPRPRFHFEAKRLGSGHAVGDYVGEDGLGCIIRAEYAREGDEAGMLGYVQSDTCAKWAQKIEQKITKDPAKFELATGTRWEPFQLLPELPHFYRTHHRRPSLGRDVVVYHTLLLCCRIG